MQIGQNLQEVSWVRHPGSDILGQVSWVRLPCPMIEQRTMLCRTMLALLIHPRKYKKDYAVKRDWNEAHGQPELPCLKLSHYMQP